MWGLRSRKAPHSVNSHILHTCLNRNIKHALIEFTRFYRISLSVQWCQEIVVWKFLIYLDIIVFPARYDDKTHYNGYEFISFNRGAECVCVCACVCVPWLAPPHPRKLEYLTSPYTVMSLYLLLTLNPNLSLEYLVHIFSVWWILGRTRFVALMWICIMWFVHKTRLWCIAVKKSHFSLTNSYNGT